MWELILTMPMQLGSTYPGRVLNVLPALPGEVQPRAAPNVIRFRAPTKFGAIQKAVTALSYLPRSMPSECFYAAAINALGAEQGNPGRVLTQCTYSWGYVSPIQSAPRPTLARPSFMARIFGTPRVSGKSSTGACCVGCENGTGCADPSSGCTGACMTATGCDCNRSSGRRQTTVGACLSYLYGTSCPPRSSPAQAPSPRPFFTGYQTGGGCGGGSPGYAGGGCCGTCGGSCGGCGSGSAPCPSPCLLGGWGYGYGGAGGCGAPAPYYGGCGYSTPCNIGCGC